MIPEGTQSWNFSSKQITCGVLTFALPSAPNSCVWTGLRSLPRSLLSFSVKDGESQAVFYVLVVTPGHSWPVRSYLSVCRPLDTALPGMGLRTQCQAGIRFQSQGSVCKRTAWSWWVSRPQILSNSLRISSVKNSASCWNKHSRHQLVAT